jgi:secondary thiamine-phosphate synthase enzyme
MPDHKTKTLSVPTRSRSQMVDITRLVEKSLPDISSGYVIVYVPHTTAGITIQESADPDVQHDLLKKLDALVPKHETYYRHAEGNSDSHLKTAIVGSSVMVLIEDGRVVLGRWQGIYLCEFDGPRDRQVIVKPVSTAAA